MSDPAKKKPGLALILAMGKGKKADSEPDGDEPSADDDGDYAASVDELADVMGIGDDQRQAFADAFRAAVMSCK